MASALVSTITHESVVPQMAITGEWTLAGEALPIGGSRSVVPGGTQRSTAAVSTAGVRSDPDGLDIHKLAQAVLG